MKKINLILVTVFLNGFLFSCSSDGIIESSEPQHAEIADTGGEDEQTPADDDDDDDDEEGN